MRATSRESLRISATDQCLCFRHIVQSLYFLIAKFQASSLCGRKVRFVVEMVGNIEDRFFHDAAHEISAKLTVTIGITPMHSPDLYIVIFCGNPQ